MAGNHELYVSEVTLQMFKEYAGKWGDKYVTSNVKVYNEASAEFEYVGATHRYFTTPKGLRIMAFGVLFDFTGSSNISQVIKAADMVKESWFTNALASKKPVDLFILFGHNPVRATDSASTFQIVWDAIRKSHPKAPIQLFGGHSHIRDFTAYDQSSVGIESGRYCETLGWMSMSGFSAANSGYKGPRNPKGVDHPCRPAVKDSKSPFLYSRRYLDWNRKTFIYHSRQTPKHYDLPAGKKTTGVITDTRKELKLGQVYGCAPQTWCLSCVPFTDKDNIFPGLIVPAAKSVVVNEKRKDKGRIILGNTGGIRFDLEKGPFTRDDSFVVSPFRNVLLYVADVPYQKADKLIQQ